MIQPISTKLVVPAGATVVAALHKDERFTKTTVSVRVGTVGVLSFRAKPLHGQFETPEAPNTIDMAVRKSIYFDGVALEELEVTNPGAQVVTLVIGQTAA